MAYGSTSYAMYPGAPDPYAAARTAQNQAQATQSQQSAQDALNRQQMLAYEMTAQQRAADKLVAEMGNLNNTFTTDGRSLTVTNAGSTGGGGSSGGGGSRVSGVNIGGGTFPNVNDLLSQFDSLSGRFGAVRPPGLPAGPNVPSTVNAFAAGKDVSGRMGNKALEALRNSMTRRGISDSGLAMAGEANILSNVANQQAQNVYDAQKIDTGRQWEANQIGYAGALQNNGQIFQGELANQNAKLDILRSLMSRLY